MVSVKSNVKKRREERIRQLTMADAAGTVPGGNNRDKIVREKARTVTHGAPAFGNGQEPDPELLWKRGQGRWQEASSRFSPDAGSGQFDGKRSSFWASLFIRLVISGLLFLGIWGIDRFGPPWSLPFRAFVAQSLTEEIDFGVVESWYERNFGGPPSFIPIFKHHDAKGVKVGASGAFTQPLVGTLASSFALSLKGVEIIPGNNSTEGAQVKSVQTGRVLSVTEDALTGQTVMVQHASGYVSIYGHLKKLSVEKGDWLEGGDIIGLLAPLSDPPLPTLYFALKKNDQYIDPADVIPLD